jgi:hypothetical protein
LKQRLGLHTENPVFDSLSIGYSDFVSCRSARVLHEKIMATEKGGQTSMAAFVEWSKGERGSWCKLGEIELDHESFVGMEGVYVIWHDPGNPVVLRVGEGSIRNRLTRERSDQRLSAYGLDGPFVTWATVNAIHRAGVARYLANTLKPALGDRYAAGSQIEVNLPRFSHRASSAP